MVVSFEAQPVYLRKDLARSIRRGQPWIYRDAVKGGEELPDGASVVINTRDGRPIARGYWDSRSPIAVRVLESGGPGHRFTNPKTLVKQRLTAALDLRLNRLDLTQTNAFRLVHGEADLLPGLHLDVYAETAVARFDGAGARAFYEPLEQLLFDVTQNSLGLQRLVERGSPLNGSAVSETVVFENGVRFIVDFVHGQKGGLFLDQRENRQLVAQRAQGKSLLNLFGYTGGFSVHAAMAGAQRTDTVDLARPALEAASRNFVVNGLSLHDASFHAVDCFAFLTDAIERGEQWDIVVSDPPSFASRKEAVPAARKAYTRLNRLAAAVTRPGGLLCTASCSSHFSRTDFIASVEAGIRQAGRSWQLEELRGAGFDHPVIEAFPEGDYLKFAVGRVS